MTRRAKNLYFDDYRPMWVDADGELMGSPHDEFDRNNFNWAGKHPRSKREFPYSYDMQTTWAKRWRRGEWVGLFGSVHSVGV